MKKASLMLACGVMFGRSDDGERCVGPKNIQFTFVNHTNTQLNFYINGNYACTANAGMVCYSTIVVPATYNFKAQGYQVQREITATVYENADNPSWTICYSTNGTCPD